MTSPQASLSRFAKLLMLALTLGAASSIVSGGSLKLSTTPYSVSPGGPFAATNSGLDISNYHTSALHNGGFLTFCLEYNEYITSGQTYLFNDDIQYYASNGGVGGATAGKDYISLGTAWLYSQFATGNLDNVDFGALQTAFWILEHEVNPVANGYVSLVQTSVANWSQDANGAYGVSVLNLYQNEKNPVHKQSQLYFGGLPTQVPDAGATVLLLGLGLAGLAAARRKTAR